jgi:hypothetical protein
MTIERNVEYGDTTDRGTKPDLSTNKMGHPRQLGNKGDAPAYG